MLNNKVAILIDGGFYVKMFKNQNSSRHPEKSDLEYLIRSIIEEIQSKSGKTQTDILFRTFYYDCEPYAKSIVTLKGEHINCADNVLYKNQLQYLNSIKFIDQFALRLGELGFTGWIADMNKKTKVIRYKPNFKQKGVDMKIGLDMAWMASKGTVDKIVLVTGDSDFISPMKLVRREGITVYLCPLGATFVKQELKAHSDFVLDGDTIPKVLK